MVWVVLPGKGSTSFRQQAALLKVVEPLIDDSYTVILLGDREFRSTTLMNFCKRRRWHFRLRLKCDTWIRANRRWFQLREFCFSSHLLYLVQSPMKSRFQCLHDEV